MILSHRKKFLFISIPKNATTAMRYSLWKWNDVKVVDDVGSYFYHHVTGGKMKEYFNQEGLGWDEYYKFAFVRNPFSRIVSQYFYTLRCADNQVIKLCSPEYYEYCLTVKARAKSFKDFLTNKDFLTKCKSWEIYQVPQLEWLTEDFDFIGKIENLPDDYKHVCREIGIPYRPLHNRNTTKHKHYTEYYDDETINLVYNKYKESIERFNYKFGE